METVNEQTRELAKARLAEIEDEKKELKLKLIGLKREALSLQEYAFASWAEAGYYLQPFIY